MAGKERLDVLLLKRGIASSRERAKAMIMEGNVYVNGMKEDKAGQAFPEDAEIEYRGEEMPYVSRGGYKLEKAIRSFALRLDGLTCLDIGASTGGFTDCMLQNGASKVYSIDVGYGQLSWKLRKDSRVVCMEKTNFRYLTEADIPDRPMFASADVSFISLSRILPAAGQILSGDASMVCLVKPQFEAGREKVGKKGVVRDPLVHEEVILSVMEAARKEGFLSLGLDFSPIKGPEGNIEYLLYLGRQGSREEEMPVKDVVRQAHMELGRNG